MPSPYRAQRQRRNLHRPFADLGGVTEAALCRPRCDACVGADRERRCRVRPRGRDGLPLQLPHDQAGGDPLGASAGVSFVLEAVEAIDDPEPEAPARLGSFDDVDRRHRTLDRRGHSEAIRSSKFLPPLSRRHSTVGLRPPWPDPAFLQWVVGKLPWGRNIELLAVKDPAARLWYAIAALEHGWSRPVLATQIDSKLYARQGKAVTNFARVLPPETSDLAQ